MWCSDCGSKVEGGYCDCVAYRIQKERDVESSEVKRIIVEYMDGRKVDVVQGYLISINADGSSHCVHFNVNEED